MSIATVRFVLLGLAVIATSTTALSGQESASRMPMPNAVSARTTP